MITNAHYILRELNRQLIYRVSNAFLIGLAIIFFNCCSGDPVDNALKTTDPSVGIENVMKITDLAKLKMISSGASDHQVRKFAKIRYYAIQTLLEALNNSPQEHKQRLFDIFLPAINILCDPEVVDEIGEIESINVKWSEIFSQYQGISNKPGEKVECSIKLNCLQFPVTCRWETRFPKYTGNGDFLEANINPADLIQRICNRLSQTKLIKIVKESNPSDVNKVAICFLTDQTLLTEIAMNDKDSVARRYAAVALTDQSSLSKIAINVQENDGVRRTAVREINNQHILETIAVSDKISEVRMEAVWKLNDQALLSKIELNDADGDVKHTASRKLAILLKIDKNDFNFTTGDLENFKDQDLLYKIFQNTGNDNKEQILWKITDQCILGKIAEEKKYSKYLQIVCFKLTDQTILKKIVEKKATYTLDNEELLSFGSKKTLWDDDRYVRCSAIENLTDQSVLAGLLGNKDFEVRSAVVWKLKDMTLLAKVAVEDNARQVREVAIRKLTDENVLRSIQENDIDRDLRDLAQKRLARLL